jgi:trimeric autotransporter adhesin
VLLSDVCGVSYAHGSLYVADGSTVRRVSPQTGWLTTPAGEGLPFQMTPPLGDGGPASSAILNQACGTVVDHSGNLVITDSGNSRVRVVAESTGTFYGRAMTAGDIYTVAGDGTGGFAGDGGPATAAELNSPGRVTVDHSGNLVITDSGNSRVRVVAESTGTFYGRAMTAGDIYTVAGDGTGGFAGDGGPATAAELNSPQGVAVDGAGNLVIADTGNSRVRVVAESTGTFYGRAMTAADVYTVAGTCGFSGDGGPAINAELCYPNATAVDHAGNLVFTGNARIRVVPDKSGTYYGQAMTAGDIYTVAGNGNSGCGGDGGPATAAALGFMQDVVVNGAGDLVIGQVGCSRVRMVSG